MAGNDKVGGGWGAKAYLNAVLKAIKLMIGVSFLCPVYVLRVIGCSVVRLSKLSWT